MMKQQNVFTKEERKFFKGARSRFSDLKYTLGVVAQFVKGFRTLHFLGPTVTVFGSARFYEGNEYYDLARKVSYELAKRGFAIAMDSCLHEPLNFWLPSPNSPRSPLVRVCNLDS